MPSRPTFPDIDELVDDCRFRDCTHDVEPGCAVIAAMAAGDLDPERFASYRKLQYTEQPRASKERDR